MDKQLLSALLGFGCLTVAATAANAAELTFREDFVRRLVASVPEILKSQDPKTGRFGTGIWIVNDQHPMYPLAVAWATESKDNPYFHDPKLLDAVMVAGDALIEDADENGQWVFRKKDGSTWGNIHQPWTYSRWVRAFSLIKDAMPADRRKKWEDALTLGYGNIAKGLGKVHNIPSHHAMGLYIAGQALEKPEWCEQARAFMAKVVSEQDPVGFWSEHVGPVVGYNFVYTDALGTYYAVSGDKTVLPVLKRAAIFHANFTYPDGSRVETVDERNPYHGGGAAMANVGFSFTPEGRGYLLQQMALLQKAGKRIHPDDLASFILYGEEGPAVPTAAAETDRTFVTSDEKALVRRKGPWFICISAYHCPVYNNRWIQDRQNLVSVFHDRVGLILGGGNTKLQPLWSNFAVGDTSLLKRTPGDTAPNFVPPSGLVHLPSAAGLKQTDPVGLGLVYGQERCSISLEPVDDDTLRIHLRSSARSGEPVRAHLTLLPRIGKPFATQRTREVVLGEESFSFTAGQAGEWLSHAGWRLSLPEQASVVWPALPHNPYVKDGSAKIGEGRIVVTLPFSEEQTEYTLELKVE